MAIDRNAVLQYWPQFAWALDIPDVAPILEEAVNASASGTAWSSAKLLARLQETPWWKGTTPAAREALELSRTDPAAVDQQKQQLEARLWDTSQAKGLNLDGTIVQSIAAQAIQFGWNEKQMEDALVSQMQFAPGKPVTAFVGDMGTSMQKLTQLAADYMVPIDEATRFNWAKRVAAGEKKPEDFTVLMQDWAKAKFAHDETIMKRIDEGFTPTQLFAPHREAIGKLLETSASSIDLTDPRFSGVIDYVDEGGRRRTASVTETERLIRKSAEWRKTTNGQQAGAKLAGAMSKMFTGV